MRYIIFIFCITFLLSCRSTKNLHHGPVPTRTKAEIYQALVNRNIDFTWFDGKMDTHLESPDENISGSMMVRMKKDSIIWIAVKKFGIEAARVLIDPKKYTVLYRFEGVYETNPVSKLNELFSVAANFEDAQQLMFGNVILADSSQMTLSKDSVYYKLQARIDDLLLSYYLNGYTLELEKMLITDQMNRTATALYSDYRNVAGYGRISYERNFIFPYEKEGTARINIKFSELTINVPKEIKFSIPDSYEKIN
ncbi:MAG: DUF4292 domain-containing protein [Saprospiraceae bacterium]|nr:DUF4292 domain-containing protein [Saprospiraceae bacterium]